MSTKSPSWRVLLAGPGRVGRAFLALARVRDDIDVAGVVASAGPTVADLLDQGRWDVVVDATPTDLESGGPALAHARLALGRGIHFATAAKGPVVLAYRELSALAARNGVGFRFSSAAGAALPTVDLIEFCFVGARILGIEGILNGTSNYILDRMLESGASLADALAEARELGIAEGDGHLDVSGVDTAAKLIAIAIPALVADLQLDQIPVSGIEQVTVERLRAAQSVGKSVRLLGRAQIVDDRVLAEVSVQLLDQSHPLAHVRGAQKAIKFETNTMGTLTLIGGRSDPVSAGAALLRDVLLLRRMGGRM